MLPPSGRALTPSWPIWPRKNAALLAERDRLQTELDTWHKANPGPITDMAAYQQFLTQIGYLVESARQDVKATTENVDAELATMAGPQLVVPILNARYALNAANARWGSCMTRCTAPMPSAKTGGAEKGKGYNPVRGAKVIAFARNFLDQAAPLAAGSHKDATGYRVEGGKLVVSLKNGSTTGLKDADKFVGYQGDAAAPSSVLLKNNGLHIDIQSSTKPPPSARPMLLAWPTWWWKPPSPPSWTWKTPWPPWTPKTRSWATATGWAS